MRKENSKYQEDLNVSKEELCTETQRTKNLCQEMWVYLNLAAGVIWCRVWYCQNLWWFHYFILFSEKLKEADCVKTQSLQMLQDENNKLAQELENSHKGQSDFVKVKHFTPKCYVNVKCYVDLQQQNILCVSFIFSPSLNVIFFP